MEKNSVNIMYDNLMSLSFCASPLAVVVRYVSSRRSRVYGTMNPFCAIILACP